jgi:hypothetical protein
MPLPTRPSISNSPAWMPTSVFWLAPRQRITAEPERWRALCRRAAIATATAASTTDTSAARPRKRSARSSARRISGRAEDAVSSRWPRPRFSRATVLKRSTAVASPATTRRWVMRLPSCTRPVAWTSSRLRNTRGAVLK